MVEYGWLEPLAYLKGTELGSRGDVEIVREFCLVEVFGPGLLSDGDKTPKV